MWKTKLCLNVFQNKVPVKEQLALFKRTGFEGFFVSWQEGIDLKDIRDCADSLGMYFQSVHAPFDKAADMWRGGENAERALDQLLDCLGDTASAGVKIMVCHTWIGFDTGEVPTLSGVENYRRLGYSLGNRNRRRRFRRSGKPLPRLERYSYIHIP